MDDDSILMDALYAINPDCDNQTWVQVGMALKDKGIGVEVWDKWSSGGSKYMPGECEKRWRSFKKTGTKAGTIIHLAEESGWIPPSKKEDSALSESVWNTIQYWEDWEPSSGLLHKDDAKPLYPEWDPIREIKTYLRHVFKPDDYVGYVSRSFVNKKGKYVPGNKGHYQNTQRQLIKDIEKFEADKDCISISIGNFDPAAGGWIRFNPLDGAGVDNENVTAWRYALVECDGIPVSEQLDKYKKLQLPIRIMVHSGGKSLHALVKIDAVSAKQYRERVEYLFKACSDHGLEMDTQNKNPSRLSRLPGLQRGENRQYIVSLDMGAASWDEWHESIEAEYDNLPDFENLADFYDQEPKLSPVLITQVLRKGHKMIVSGPSKAGKSFLLLELAIAIATGTDVCGIKCALGKVLYVNLEIDKESCKDRIRKIFKSKNLPIDKNTMSNLHVWNLRGNAMSMDQLTPRLIARMKKENYAAVIIDPIYKVITGDENNASEMAKFCNYFDRVANETGASPMYCHHFSKGTQSGKASIDRASGSGVFGRDPDGILSVIELAVPPQKESKRYEKELIPVAEECLKLFNYDVLCADRDKYKWNRPEKDAGEEAWTEWYNERSYASDYAAALIDAVKATPENEETFLEYRKKIDQIDESIRNMTAWRIEFTLREFPNHKPLNMYFSYPIHLKDDEGWLEDSKYKDENSASQMAEKSKESREKRAGKDLKILEETIEKLMGDGDRVKRSDLVEYFENEKIKGFSRNMIGAKIQKSLHFTTIKEGRDWFVIRADDED